MPIIVELYESKPLDTKMLIPDKCSYCDADLTTEDALLGYFIATETIYGIRVLDGEVDYNEVYDSKSGEGGGPLDFCCTLCGNSVLVPVEEEAGSQ